MNERIYGEGHVRPPILQIEKVADVGIPVVVYYAKGDTVVYPQDTEWLMDQIKKVVVDAVEVDGGHV